VIDLNRFLADLHVHTRASNVVFSQSRLASIVAAHDCYTNEEDILPIAKERGINAVAITDHNKIDNAIKMYKKNSEFFIPACEYDISVPKSEEFNFFLNGRYANGNNLIHILGYGITDPLLHNELLKSSSNLELFSKIAKNAGVVTALAHPSYFEWPLSYIKTIVESVDLNEEKSIVKPKFYEFCLKNVDLIETIDGNQISNDFSQMLADYYNLPTIGGSDSHSLCTIGRAYTLFDDVSNARECLERLREKKGFSAGGVFADIETLCNSMFEAVEDFIKFESETIKRQGFLNYLKQDLIKYLVTYWIVKPFHKPIIRVGMKSYERTMNKLQQHLIDNFKKYIEHIN